MRRFKLIMFVGVGIAWAAGTCFGLAKLWSYETTAGAGADAHSAWPALTQVQRPQNNCSLVLSIHPHCPCSRATVDELAKLMAACHGKLTATVLMVRPSEKPVGWEQTSLWQSAASIPGVAVIADIDGTESKRFASATSGQAFLHATDGRLLFAGGITKSRGHSGDNAGRSAIQALVLNSTATPDDAVARTSVFGCPLFTPVPICQNEGKDACLR